MAILSRQYKERVKRRGQVEIRKSHSPHHPIATTTPFLSRQTRGDPLQVVTIRRNYSRLMEINSTMEGVIVTLNSLVEMATYN